MLVGLADGFLSVGWLRDISTRDGQMVLLNRSLCVFIGCFALRARLL